MTARNIVCLGSMTLQANANTPGVNHIAIGASMTDVTAISIGNPDKVHERISIGHVDLLAVMARIAALEAQVLELRYAPGMPGAVEAEASFKSQIEE